MPRFPRLLLVPPICRSVVDREVERREQSASPLRLPPELSCLKPGPRRAKYHGAVWRTARELALGRSPSGQSLVCPKKSVSSHSQLSAEPCCHAKDRTFKESFYPLSVGRTARRVHADGEAIPMDTACVVSLGTVVAKNRKRNLGRGKRWRALLWSMTECKGAKCKGAIRTFSRSLWDATSDPSFVRSSRPKRCCRLECSAACT
jgi:hypothetical protein